MTDSNVAGSSAGGGPCGACKFLRRKCASGCIFAPYFDAEQGPAQFAAVHKVFGASNFSKLLLHIPVHHRPDAVASICYEARARLGDPVYGCVSHIFALQQQVMNLQAELSYLQARLPTSDHPPPLPPPPPPPPPLTSLSIEDLPMPASYDHLPSLMMDSSEVHSLWTTLHRHRPGVDLPPFLTSSASGSRDALEMPSSSTKDGDEDFSESPHHQILNKREPSKNNQSLNFSAK